MMKNIINLKSLVFILIILTFLGIYLTILNIPPKIYKKIMSMNEDCQSYCPTDNIITIRQGGRLGNCVWEYIAVLGLGESVGFCKYVPKSIIDCMGKVFKNLNIPAYEDTLLSEYCRKIHGGDVNKCESETLSQNGTKWDRLCYRLKHGQSSSYGVAFTPDKKLRKMKKSGKLPTIFILPKWIAQHNAFLYLGIKRFQQELPFRDDIRMLAEATLNAVREKAGAGDLIFVGIHVRRTDYFKKLTVELGKKVAFADLDYHKRAMNRMRTLFDYSRMVFVVIGDDYEWCKNNLVNETEGVFWGGLQNSTFIKNWEEKIDMDVGHDLAVLALQNHSIIGYGTYAVTGSLLNGGYTIVSDVFRNGSHGSILSTYLSKALPNWEAM